MTKSKICVLLFLKYMIMTMATGAAINHFLAIVTEQRDSLVQLNSMINMPQRKLDQLTLLNSTVREVVLLE